MRPSIPLRAVAVLFLLPAIAVAEEIPNPWAEMAREDLAFIHDELAANHPGAIDAENEEFGLWLESGYREALEKTGEAESLDDVLAILRYYVAGFADGHTYLDLDYGPRWMRWPGFVPAWSAGRYLVHRVASEWPGELPPEGAALVACDGRPIERLVEEDLLPYRDGRTMLEATFVAQTPWLFARGLEKGLPKPERCTFRADGETRQLDLVWRWHQARELEAWISEAAQRATGEIGQEETAPGEHWIRLPTFQPRGNDAERMREIVDGMAELRDAERIVFDVRGNTGGSSVWGNEIVANLFGPEVLRWVECQHEGTGAWAEWRVSEKNLARVIEVQPEIGENFGQDSPVFAVFSQLRGNLEKALEAGETWVRQPEVPDEGGDLSCPETAPESLVRARVVLLTDGACGSACLDFADELLLMPDAIHAGTPTGADTVYMEIRDVPLPSRLGRVSCAMKVYRNRSRGHNEPYVPAHRFDGDMTDTEALQEWVRTLASTAERRQTYEGR